MENEINDAVEVAIHFILSPYSLLLSYPPKIFDRDLSKFQKLMNQADDDMLKTQLLHPEILRICAECGHHAKILIADGNYPASSKKGPNAKVVSLQLTPGIPTVSQVLKVLLASIPIDQLFVMGIDPSDSYAQKEDPVVWTEYREIVRHHDSSKGGTLSQIESIMKWDFYAAVQSEDHVLTVQTADQALWANVLLSVGVRTKD